jgi:hypothetical protein
LHQPFHRLAENGGIKETKRHLSSKFWKKSKTMMKLISLTSKLCLQHGPEKPNQRNEVYGSINISIAIINFPHYDVGNVLQFGQLQEDQSDETSDEEIWADVDQIFHGYLGTEKLCSLFIIAVEFF